MVNKSQALFGVGQMEILIDLVELRNAGVEIQDEVKTLKELTNSISTTFLPIRKMKSERIEIYLELYKKVTFSMNESIAILSYLSQELKQFADDVEKVVL